MKSYNFLIVLAVAGFCYALSTIGSGCAQVGMPLGGPKDTIPPVLVNSTPPNQSIHFTGNRIVLTFDEYVHLQDIQKSLNISPVPKIIPNITSKLKTVSIKIRDTLQPNTTYSFQFGNSIQDIDENNPLHNFTYVFSTGSFIDSLTFNGSVVMAETGRPDSTLIAMLYKDLDDSAVYKHKPRYAAFLDSTGNFHFKNLAEGIYHLFALKDESGLKMYNNPSQVFAFADSNIVISQEVKTAKLFAYAEQKNDRPNSKPSAPIKKSSEKILKYSTPVSVGPQDLLSPLMVTFEVPLKNFDPSKIKLSDTLFNPVKAAEISIDTTDKKVTVRNNWTEDTKYKLVIDKDFAEDTLGDALLKSDTITFSTKKEKEYGSIKLDFKHLEKIAHPVLQFVQNDKVVDSFKLTTPTFFKKLFDPGEYEIRILNDENDNGTWDPGNYHLRKQPEKVISITKKISIRGDWDNESDIIL